MPYTITPATDGDYVLIKVVGEITREAATGFIADSHPVGEELGVRCFLVDVTEARNVENVLDNYKFATTDVRSTPEADRRACIALLAAPDDHSHDFVVTLGKNAGLDMSLFRDRADAVAHLKGASERFDAQLARSDRPQEG